MDIRVQWHGADEFVAAHRELERRQPAFIKYEALTAANTIASDFRPKVPVLTGRAQRSISVTQVDKDAVLRAGLDIEYWKFLDFGGTTGRGHRRGRGGGSVKRKSVGKSGRFYWRSLETRFDDILESASKRLAAEMRRCGLEVTTHGQPQRR